MRRLTDVRRDERGIVLVLVALVMVAILFIVALVVDLGYVRNTRQQAKADADFAVAAGLRGLESADGVPRPWGGVCAARSYLVANAPGLAGATVTFTTGAGGAVTGNPCSSATTLDQPCVAGTPSSWARITLTAGSTTYRIQSGYVTPDPAFPEDAANYSGDNGSATFAGCDQLAVIGNSDSPAFFGGIGGQEDYPTSVRSVGRVTVGDVGTETVALLLLEQTACGALETSGNNTFVYVRATPIAAPTRPGLIQANSTGTTDCSGSSRVLMGSSACPAIAGCTGGNGPSIVAQGTATLPGRIGVRAVTTAAGFATTTACPTATAPTSGCTVAPTPTDRGIVTRGPVDARYLSRVRSLKTTAANATTMTSAAATAAGYAVFNNCNALPANGAGAVTSTTAGRAKIFINGNCSAPSSLVFDSTITDLVVTGSLSVGSGRLLEAASVRRVYVGNGLSVQGTLRINRGTSTSCTARRSAAPTLVTQLVVSTGAFTGGAQTALSLCSTFVYLADGALPTSNGVAPYNNSFTSTINLGAQTTLDWTAPNQTNSQLTNTAVEYDQFEDLALWTEFSGTSSCSAGGGPGIGGQGAVTATGVFFAPNACPFNISGGGFGANVGSDAQFIVRRLRLSGTTQLTMAPNPENAVPTPKFESFVLVR